MVQSLFSSIFTTVVPKDSSAAAVHDVVQHEYCLASKGRHRPAQKLPPWHIQIPADAKASWTDTAARVFSYKLSAPV